jgi:hypothetical protein
MSWKSYRMAKLIYSSCTVSLLTQTRPFFWALLTPSGAA